MPGTVKLEFWNMSLADALSVLATDDATLGVHMPEADDLAELRRAARAVAEDHAAEVAARYTRSPLAPFLKLIQG
jgi:hypothetical protein